MREILKYLPINDNSSTASNAMLFRFIFVPVNINIEVI